MNLSKRIFYRCFYERVSHLTPKLGNEFEFLNEYPVSAWGTPIMDPTSDILISLHFHLFVIDPGGGDFSL
jgi:hypothetical protein